MMFIPVHFRESGRSLLEPQQETGEPGGRSVWDVIVPSLKGKNTKAKQEIGYMNAVRQLRSLKKVRIRGNAS